MGRPASLLLIRRHTSDVGDRRRLAENRRADGLAGERANDLVGGRAGGRTGRTQYCLFVVCFPAVNRGRANKYEVLRGPLSDDGASTFQNSLTFLFVFNGFRHRRQPPADTPAAERNDDPLFAVVICKVPRLVSLHSPLQFKLLLLRCLFIEQSTSTSIAEV